MAVTVTAIALRVITMKDIVQADVPCVHASVAPHIVRNPAKAATSLVKAATSHVPATIVKVVISPVRVAISLVKAAISPVLITIAVVQDIHLKEEPREAIVPVPLTIILMPSTA